MYQGIQGAVSGICAEIVNYFVADGTWLHPLNSFCINVPCHVSLRPRFCFLPLMTRVTKLHWQ